MPAIQAILDPLPADQINVDYPAGGPGGNGGSGGNSGNPGSSGNPGNSGGAGNPGNPGNTGANGNGATAGQSGPAPTTWPGMNAPNTWPGMSGTSASSLYTSNLYNATLAPNAISRVNIPVTVGNGGGYNGQINVSWNQQ